MRYLLLIAVILAPVNALALAGNSARFDTLQGQPAITHDATTVCNNQAKIAYYYLNGQPRGVYDGTATCTAAGGTPVEGESYIINFE